MSDITVSEIFTKQPDGRIIVSIEKRVKEFGTGKDIVISSIQNEFTPDQVQAKIDACDRALEAKQLEIEAANLDIARFKELKYGWLALSEQQKIDAKIAESNQKISDEQAKIAELELLKGGK